jgi:hypothetical protein
MQHLPAGRIHALDALRAFALLLGVVLHSALNYVLPPGTWAVSNETVPFLVWFVVYTHTFRLETFFLLAGFFGAMMAGRRGVRAYLRDRTTRVLLVFAAVVLPAQLSRLARGTTLSHLWNTFNLTHLWFLYYLFCIIVLFLALRWLALRLVSRQGAGQWLDGALHAIMASRLQPLLLAIALAPLFALGGSDLGVARGLVPKTAPLALYGSFFALGWWLHLHADLLAVFARRCFWLTLLGLLASVVLLLLLGDDVAPRGGAIPHARAVYLAAGLVAAASVFGWIGIFVRFLHRPSPAMRYLADSSYWIYIAHVPPVVALQVWWAHAGLPWWIQVPLINLIVVPPLLLLYAVMVRPTWIGAWLNGKRMPAWGKGPEPAAPRA